ncbi:hypothetical protein Tco_0747626 [Tanacetum coccineum]|uniref:Uncharacterized protein n=1 Tax=Tanacetum coccineum TaxID=301880 RepID=A0ABQ4YVS3_9ASTR
MALCFCGLPAVTRTSRTDANPGCQVPGSHRLKSNVVFIWLVWIIPWCPKEIEDNTRVTDIQKKDKNKAKQTKPSTGMERA